LKIPLSVGQPGDQNQASPVGRLGSDSMSVLRCSTVPCTSIQAFIASRSCGEIVRIATMI
jgi:hypothetical protein